MSLDNLPERPERFVSRERESFVANVRETGRFEDRARGGDGPFRIGRDLVGRALKLLPDGCQVASTDQLGQGLTRCEQSSAEDFTIVIRQSVRCKSVEEA